MSERPCFLIGDGESFFYKEEIFEFEWFSGFALQQKQKSIQSFHKAILEKYPKAQILEISKSSTKNLGKEFSAFNLKFKMDNEKEYPLECVFQSSKVFENGGPFTDLLKKTPRDVKQDERLKNSGKLIHFSLSGEIWETEPKSYFYDYIYIKAFYERYKSFTDASNYRKELLKYTVFTDIAFNPYPDNKSKKTKTPQKFNCQARSVAIAVTLLKRNLLKEYLSDKTLFKTIYKKPQQLL